MEKPFLAIIGSDYTMEEKENILEYFNLVGVLNPLSNENNIENLLKDKNVKNIYINSPKELNFDLVKKCLLFNKNVLVNSPLVDDYKKAVYLMNLAIAKNLKLGVNYPYLFDESFQKLLSFIDKPEGIEEINIQIKCKSHEEGYGNILLGDCLAIVDSIIPVSKLEFVKDKFSNNSKIVSLRSKKDVFKKQVEGRIEVTTNYPDGEVIELIIHLSNGIAKWSPTSEKNVKFFEYSKNSREEFKNENSWEFEKKSSLKSSMIYFNKLIQNRVKTNIASVISMIKFIYK